MADKEISRSVLNEIQSRRIKEARQIDPTHGLQALAEYAPVSLGAYFSDRGRLFQADRGRRIGVAVAALGKRAGTGATVAQSSTISLKRSAVVLV